MVENGGNVSKAMRVAGYSPATAHTPQKLTESKGFQHLCEQRGLTDELLVDALVDDIKKKKGHREKELALGFKVRGKLKEQSSPQSPRNIAYFVAIVEGREPPIDGNKDMRELDS